MYFLGPGPPEQIDYPWRGGAANYAIIDKLTDFARERDHTLADLAIAWVLAEPAVATVLAGASSDEQMAANARAASWELSAAESLEIRAILEGEEKR